VVETAGKIYLAEIKGSGEAHGKTVMDKAAAAEGFCRAGCPPPLLLTHHSISRERQRV
jgi:hypothetical protein